MVKKLSARPPVRLFEPSDRTTMLVRLLQLAGILPERPVEATLMIWTFVKVDQLDGNPPVKPELTFKTI